MQKSERFSFLSPIVYSDKFFVPSNNKLARAKQANLSQNLRIGRHVKYTVPTSRQT